MTTTSFSGDAFEVKSTTSDATVKDAVEAGLAVARLEVVGMAEEDWDDEVEVVVVALTTTVAAASATSCRRLLCSASSFDLLRVTLADGLSSSIVITLSDVDDDKPLLSFYIAGSSFKRSKTLHCILLPLVYSAPCSVLCYLCLLFLGEDVHG
jgi:hypothetical protein